jgi:hypothetical protein
MTHKKPVEGREKNLLNKIHLSQQVKWSICFPVIEYTWKTKDPEILFCRINNREDKEIIIICFIKSVKYLN